MQSLMKMYLLSSQRVSIQMKNRAGYVKEKHLCNCANQKSLMAQKTKNQMLNHKQEVLDCKQGHYDFIFVCFQGQEQQFL